MTFDCIGHTGRGLRARHPILPADLRLELYQETMQLRAVRGWGYRRISRTLSEAHRTHVPRGTVQNWILGTHNPSRRLHRYFEAIPSPELSYVIGIVLGDGYTTEDQGRGIVGLTNRDMDLLKHFLSCISRILHRQSAGRITKGTPFGTLKATVGSRLLALFLQKPLQHLAPFIEKHPASFISGFLDAEGCAMVSVSRGRLSVGVSASNTDLRLLEYVHDLLRDRYGIDSTINVGRRPWRTLIHGQAVTFRKTVFQLRIRGLHDVRIFAAKIGFSSIRKRRILKDALAALRDQGSRSAASRWLQDYEKIGTRWCRKTLELTGGPGEI